MCTCINLFVFKCIYVRASINYMCMHVNIYVCVYISVCVAHVFVCIFIYIYADRYMCIVRFMWYVVYGVWVVWDVRLVV